MDAHLLELATKVARLKQQMDSIGLVNVYNASPEVRVSIDISARLAEKEWRAAQAEYEKAIDLFCESSTG